VLCRTVLVGVLAVGLAVTAGAAGQGGALPGLQIGPAPWWAESTHLFDRMQALGIPALTEEGQVVHTHQHLDVFVRGQRLIVPASIGIDAQSRFIAPVHTHDPTGIIHVESPVVRTFTLGQFFGLWGVRFTPRCIGGYCERGAARLRVFVNGRPVRGDARALALREHQQIVIAFGTERQLPRPIPARFPFARYGL
jgi:hypothetical protein